MNFLKKGAMSSDGVCVFVPFSAIMVLMSKFIRIIFCCGGSRVRCGGEKKKRRYRVVLFVGVVASVLM